MSTYGETMPHNRYSPVRPAPRRRSTDCASMATGACTQSWIARAAALNTSMGRDRPAATRASDGAAPRGLPQLLWVRVVPCYCDEERGDRNAVIGAVIDIATRGGLRCASRQGLGPVGALKKSPLDGERQRERLIATKHFPRLNSVVALGGAYICTDF
jgi:hypothetical protein